MTNNDILRRIRYTFDFKDSEMVNIFGAADHAVTQANIVSWLKKEDDKEFSELLDVELATFLNGLINTKRGKREGEQPKPESRLTNNMIFMKLRIALNMKAEDILEILALVDFRLSKHELSAFFRKPENKHYRECGDQVLRNFLTGVQHQLRLMNNNKQ
ncbi:glutamate synthase (NADPH) large chain [Vibrio ishigakensis]|uniref:Glutamate synthase (NADPH) large chain n=1 Tax=Vibrio ishigakensis TaxID=1481914 RepID=A0A0B8QJC4_9VIBR|nr:glutamate synthase (NADPH) large chain [Vibrio ishigakensis]